MQKSPLILAVDDEEPILKLLHAILSAGGYHVITASDGIAALALLEEQEPDLIILDIKMPGLNGFQVLNLIRQDYNVPVIILTAQDEVTCMCDALEQGADDYITKPFSTLELIARVRAILRRYMEYKSKENAA